VMGKVMKVDVRRSYWTSHVPLKKLQVL
jgi:hypothetical protein